MFWCASCDIVRYATWLAAEAWPGCGAEGSEGQGLNAGQPRRRFRDAWVTLIDVAYIKSCTVGPGSIIGALQKPGRRGDWRLAGCKGDCRTRNQPTLAVREAKRSGYRDRGWRMDKQMGRRRQLYPLCHRSAGRVGVPSAHCVSDSSSDERADAERRRNPPSTTGAGRKPAAARGTGRPAYRYEPKSKKNDGIEQMAVGKRKTQNTNNKVPIFYNPRYFPPAARPRMINR